MHACNTSTISLEKTALLDKLHKLEESNLEKVDKLVKLEENGRNANKTSDSDENQALAKEKNDLLRQIDFLNSVILDTKLKEPNKKKVLFVKKRKQLHIDKKRRTSDNQNNPVRNRTKLRPKVGQQEGSHLTSTVVDFMKRWSPLMPDDFMIAI
ncbi:hypothetical protein TNCV_2201911 [Trichonephila clavipes]|uniref:Uncharacterized protein n=1 Tax=Trichonephila clavipes TaxID=2585209 RepID=A0A8X6RBY8_TRICX|nr:hypothetical protein TNCV_2201911 [Trichonephila clavipes]